MQAKALDLEHQHTERQKDWEGRQHEDDIVDHEKDQTEVSSGAAARSPEGESAGQSPGEGIEESGDEHLAWLRSHLKLGTELPPSDKNRRILFELLAMLAGQNRCQDILDTVGLAGHLKPGDTVFLRGHTGRWLGTRNATIVCNKPDRREATPFTLESKSSSLRHESKAVFRLAEAPDGPPGAMHFRLGVTQAYEVRTLQRPDGAKDGETQFVVMSETPGMILSGTPVYLKSVGCGRTLDVEGDAVRARTQEQGTQQRIAIEKLPLESDVPSACGELELGVEEKAWLFRRGVCLAMVDKQQLAKFLGSHRPTCKELLKAYTRLWEAEWRRGWQGNDAAEDSASSPASRSTREGEGAEADRGGRRPPSKPRKSKRDWIFGMVSGVNSDDKTNGNLFIGALRSFFATALRMSQLEADPVQRVIEAFAEALVNDSAFMESFTPSMLPEAERKTYRTPEEVLFGLTYTTLMLNTDTHNKQVSQKMWDTKKFVGAGKDCGVTGGLMMQIFKNVQKEEL